MEAPVYRCPGQQHPISRAVHLGRLASFYPACQQCAHRDDTGTLSLRQVEQLQEVRSSNQQPSLFHDEGAGGVYLNQLTSAAARSIAAAFGAVIRQEGREERGEGRGAVLLAGDGRPLTAELTAAVAEGIRWTGCDLVDIGSATAACLAYAVHRLQAAGGILVGNPGRQPHVVGLQFWAAGPKPLSVGGPLEPIVERYRAGADRPARNFGQLRRFQADVPYLAAMKEHYHAMRPLRVVVDSASRPWLEYLQRLAASVACQVIACRSAHNDLPLQIRAESAHVAVSVDGDGESCRVFDEQGRGVPTERLLLLLAGPECSRHTPCAETVSEQCSRHTPCADRSALDAVRPSADRPADRIVVLENGTPQPLIAQLKQRGIGVVFGGDHRAEMWAAMRGHNALLGGGPSGRFWHAETGLPLPDALMTVTRLLMLLSRSDEPFSAVLDRDGNLG